MPQLISHEVWPTYPRDLVWCYKVVFGMVDKNTDDFFLFNN